MGQALRSMGHPSLRPARAPRKHEPPSRSQGKYRNAKHGTCLMSQTERLYKLKSLLDAGQCLTKSRLLEELATSPATLKRDLAHLRDRMNAPIVFDRERGGWRLDRAATTVGTQYELPGLWLSAEEIHALLTMQHLLAHLDAGGLLPPHIEPMMKRLRQMLVAPGKGAPSHEELTRRIHVQTVGARQLHLPHFQSVGTALLRRQRLQIEYYGRGRNAAQPREVSPQRLIHYRDNWYLDAWCHLRQALRCFSVDTIRQVQVLQHKAIDVPYAELRELVMDILRHVPEVEVLGPVGLREAVMQKLRDALGNMRPLTPQAGAAD